MNRLEVFSSWSQTLLEPGSPDEFEVKCLLKSFGIVVPNGLRIAAVDEISVLDAISPPYVVKVCAGDILHKTDIGGVRVDVERDALPGEMESMFSRFPGRHLLVEEMVSFGGPEFIIGGVVDPDFGPVIMTGAGGVLAEIYSDVVFRLVPLTMTETRRMLEELTISPVLHGYRGSDLTPDGLAELISATAGIIEAAGAAFVQLDLNPVVFDSGVWTVLDAKAVLNQG